MITTWLALIVSGFICFLFRENPVFLENTVFVSWSIVVITSIPFTVHVFMKYGKDAAMCIIILAGYYVRVALIFWDLNFSHVFLLFHSGADTEGFYLAALMRHSIGYLPADINPYVRFLFHLFGIIGPQRILAQFLNLMISITSVLLIMRAVQRYTTIRSTILATLAMGMLVPHFMILNVILLREALMVGILAVSLYFFVVWFKEGRKLALVLAIGLSFYAGTIHASSAAPGIGYILCVILYDRRLNSFRVQPRAIGMALLGIGFVYVIDMFFGSVIFGHFQNIDSALSLIEHAEHVERGNAAFSALVHTGNEYLDLIINTPIRLMYLVLSPLPWYWRGPWDVIAFSLSTLFYILFYYTMIRALKNPDIKDKQLIIALLIVSIITSFVLGWGISNFGSAMRHRDKFFLQHVLMFAYSFEKIWAADPLYLGFLRRGSYQIHKKQSRAVVSNSKIE